MKTNNVKKILSITIISLIVAITIATVILAIIPKKLYNPIATNYSAVTVYKDKNKNNYSEAISDENKAIIDKINELQAKSVKDNMLSALFQGTGSYESRVVSYNEGNVMTSIADVSGAVCLVFQYLEEQELIWQGEKYTNPQATNPNKVVTYTKIFMPISSNESFEECTVYLADNSNKSSYQIKFLAHQSELYDYLISLEWPMVSE